MVIPRVSVNFAGRTKQPTPPFVYDELNPPGSQRPEVEIPDVLKDLNFLNWLEQKRRREREGQIGDRPVLEIPGRGPQQPTPGQPGRTIWA